MKSLILIIVAFFVVVVGLSTYLAPDGLTSCGVKPDNSQFDCQKVDAIVAISGGDTRARTDQAIALYKNGWANKLVFSGAAQDKSGPSNAEAMQLRAQQANVPAEAIILDETSETTKQNAENTRDLFDKNDIHSVILVTSAYHQRRAGLEFGKRAGTDIRLVNHPVAADNQWNQWWWLTPGGWWLALGEFFKIIAFYMGGSR